MDGELHRGIDSNVCRMAGLRELELGHQRLELLLSNHDLLEAGVISTAE